MRTLAICNIPDRPGVAGRMIMHSCALAPSYACGACEILTLRRELLDTILAHARASEWFHPTRDTHNRGIAF